MSRFRILSWIIVVVITFVSTFVFLVLVLSAIRFNTRNECYPFNKCQSDPTQSPSQSIKIKVIDQNAYYGRYSKASSQDSAYYSGIVIAIGVCMCLISCFVCIPYCLYYKCKLQPPNNNNDAEDNWTRPQIASISNDQPPAYANVNAGIMEHAPSAPLAAFVDVSGVIVDVDDPPSYYEVVASP